MKIVVVGDDRLGPIAAKLKNLGITEIEHIPCRNAAAQENLHIPAAAVLIIVLVDFLNHNSMKLAKLGAKSRSIPVVFAKRSWTSICSKLVQAGLSQPQ